MVSRNIPELFPFENLNIFSKNQIGQNNTDKPDFIGKENILKWRSSRKEKNGSNISNLRLSFYQTPIEDKIQESFDKKEEFFKHRTAVYIGKREFLNRIKNIFFKDTRLTLAYVKSVLQEQTAINDRSLVVELPTTFPAIISFCCFHKRTKKLQTNQIEAVGWIQSKSHHVGGNTNIIDPLSFWYPPRLF